MNTGNSQYRDVSVYIVKIPCAHHISPLVGPILKWEVRFIIGSTTDLYGVSTVSVWSFDGGENIKCICVRKRCSEIS